MMIFKGATCVVCCLLILQKANGEHDEDDGNHILYKFFFGGSGNYGDDGVTNCPTEPVTCETRIASAVYTRWGRSDCNTSTSDMVYSGYIGGGHYTHSGAATNALCLPETPEYDDGLTSADASQQASVYGGEYQTNGYSPMAGLHEHDPVCAVCLARGRSSILMIPAKFTCPSGWTKEYGGLLMGNKDNLAAGHEYLCIDRNPQSRDGSQANDNGFLLYPAEGKCGTLPCPPYVNNNVLSCVVCSK